MHALQFDVVGDLGFMPLADAGELSLGRRGDTLDVGAFLAGLHAFCRNRFDADTCHEVLDDTHRLLAEAGFTSWSALSRAELAAVLLSSTCEWEYVGDEGTIDLVLAQRDYTRSVVGEEQFWLWYQGMETVDGRSYHHAL